MIIGTRLQNGFIKTEYTETYWLRELQILFIHRFYLRSLRTPSKSKISMLY